jgi:hypothetical protein
MHRLPGSTVGEGEKEEKGEREFGITVGSKNSVHGNLRFLGATNVKRRAGRAGTVSTREAYVHDFNANGFFPFRWWHHEEDMEVTEVVPAKFDIPNNQTYTIHLVVNDHRKLTQVVELRYEAFSS